MKNYPVYQYLGKKVAQQQGASWHEVKNNADRIIHRFCETSWDPRLTDKDLAIGYLATLELQTFVKRPHHIFIASSEFAHYLADCASGLDFDAISMVNAFWDGSPNWLHSPNPEGVAMLWSFYRNSGKTTFAFRETTGPSIVLTPLTDYSDPNISKAIKSKMENTFCFRLLCGVACYADVYPESLSDGWPEDMDPNGQCKNSRTAHTISPTFETIERMREIARLNTGPRRDHKVRDYFKVLSSPIWTNKQGERIHVKAHWRRGSAETMQFVGPL